MDRQKRNKEPDEIINLGIGRQCEIYHHREIKTPGKDGYKVSHTHIHINTDTQQMFIDRIDHIDAQLEELERRVFLRRTKRHIRNIRSQILDLKVFVY